MGGRMSGSQSELYGGGAAGMWVSGTTYAQGKFAISPTNFNTYVRKVTGSGATDPVSDAANWQLAGGSGIKSIQRGLSTFSSGASLSVTIAAVITNNTELRMLGFSASGSATGADYTTIKLTNSTTLTLTRGAASATPVSVSWELTERY